MKITILANKDLAANYALNLLLPSLQDHKVSLFLSSRVGKPSTVLPPKLVSLKQLEHQLQQDLNDSKFKTFEQLTPWLAEAASMLDKINSEQGLAALKATSPDIIISIRYGNIIKNGVIAVPKYGVINLHSGLLPDYRGVMATFWAMLNGEQTIGSTLHYIQDASIDTGDVIATSTLPVQTDKSFLWHVLSLYIGGTGLLLNAIKAIEQQGHVETLTQPSGGNYYSYPDETDIEAFENKGLRLGDKDSSADLLELNHPFS